MIDAELLRVLETHLQVPIVFTAAPMRLTGGFWASIHGFQIAGAPGEWGQPLVLRVMPAADAAAREIAVQRTVARQGFATPAVLLDGFDDALGGAFMIMTRASGSSPLGSLQINGSLLTLPRTLRRLPGQLASVAADLHALDPSPVADALTEVESEQPGGLHGVAYRLAFVRDAATTPSAGFDVLADWLDAHQPPDVQRVVCHGDIHPFNLLVDRDGAITVLDWTNANLVRREFDVGFTAGLLRCAPIGVPAPLRPVVRRLTNWLAEEFVRQYDARSAVGPIDRAALDWYEALQHARCLAEVASARAGRSHVVGPDHPFETAAAAMKARLAALTGVPVTLAPRRAPAS